MTFIPAHRPPGVGEGDSRVADIAAAKLLESSMTDLGATVPPWVRLLALGMIAPNPADEIDLLSGLTRAVARRITKPRESPHRHRGRWFSRFVGYQLERPPPTPVDPMTGVVIDAVWQATRDMQRTRDVRLQRTVVDDKDEPKTITIDLSTVAAREAKQDPARPDQGSAGKP